MSRIKRRTERVAKFGALIAALVLILGACANGEEEAPDSGDPGAQEDRVFGFSMPFLTNEFFIALNDLTVSRMKDDGWEVLSTTDAQQQPDKQVQDVRNLIAGGATGLAIDPFDSGAIVRALDLAEEAGVPVVLVDVAADGGTAFMSIRADNHGAGATACEEIGNRLTEKYGDPQGTVLQLQGELASVAGRDRTNGFEECMEEDFPDVRIISRPTQWRGEEAANAAETVVSAEEIDAIYMQSDCGMLQPVQAVLRSAGHDTRVGDEDHIILGAIDGCPHALDAIREGTLDFTVEQPLTDYAQRVSYFLNAALEGEEFETGPDEFGGEIVEAPTGLENLVPATLVTEDNVDDDELWGNQVE